MFSLKFTYFTKKRWNNKQVVCAPTNQTQVINICLQFTLKFSDYFFLEKEPSPWLGSFLYNSLTCAWRNDSFVCWLLANRQKNTAIIMLIVQKLGNPIVIRCRWLFLDCNCLLALISCHFVMRPLWFHRFKTLVITKSATLQLFS